MNENQDNARPEHANDRALLGYLSELLDPGSVAPVAPAPRHDSLPAAKVTPLERARPRHTPHSPQPLKKVESKQGITLPFPTRELVEKPRILASPSLLNLTVAPPPEPEPVQVPAPEARLAPEPVVIAEVAPVEPAPVAEDPPAPPVAPAEPILPPWAQERFECLIFKVAGLKLAVPLVCLGAIHKIDRRLNELPQQSEWFIGILQTQAAGNIKVLDTALCVMPERYDPASRQSLAYVITIHGYSWGLACHALEKSITLEPHQVKWRTARGKRPWLAGTVIDQMCALIDTDGFHTMIERAEQHG